MKDNYTVVQQRYCLNCQNWFDETLPRCGCGSEKHPDSLTRIILRRFDGSFDVVDNEKEFMKSLIEQMKKV